MNKNKHQALSFSNKAVELVEINVKSEVTGFGRVALSKQALDNFLPANDLVEKAIAKVQKTSKPQAIEIEDVQVVLPGENFLLTTVVADQDKKSDFLLKKELPGPINSWLVCHQEFINPETENKSFVITAVKKDVISLWQNSLKLANINNCEFIPDYIALTACVEQDGLRAVLNLGDYNSKLLIVFDSKIIWGESLPFGEKTWQQSIDDFNDMSEDDIIAGYDDLFKKRPRKGSLAEKAENELEPLIELVKASISDFERFFSMNIEELVLFGDMAGVKGLNDVLSKLLDLPVTIGHCPAKKVKSQNYASTWGGAKLTLISNIYNISMPKFLPEDNEEEVPTEKLPVTKLKNRSIDAVVLSTNNTRTKKNPVASTLIVGLLLIVIIASAIWFYSNWQTNQPIEEKNNLVTNTETNVVSEPKLFTADIRFNFEADKVNADGQRIARTVKVQLNNKATSTDESFALATSDLAEDEVLWPIMFGTDTWLVYRQPLLIITAQEYLTSLNASTTVPIEVVSLVPKKIVENKLTGGFTVTATVEVKNLGDVTLNIPDVNDIIADLNTLTTSTNVVSKDIAEGELLIANTPSGWANVRGGPGLQNEIVGKVNDGEKYQILEQNNEWYKIKLTTGEMAWIIKKYTTTK